MRKDAQEKNEGPLTSKTAQICPLMLSPHSLSPTHSEAWDEEGCGLENILKLQGLDRAGLTHPSSINMGVPNGSRSSADTSW